MKIQLNQNLHNHKKGEIVDLKLCSPDDARYWRKSIRDSKIDKSVSVITDKEIEEKNNKKENKEVKNDTAS